MSLSNLFGWNKKAETQPAAACGSACGAGDKPEEKPAACGTACGAGDKQAAGQKKREALAGAADAVPGGAHVRLDKEYPAEPVYDR